MSNHDSNDFPTSVIVTPPRNDSDLKLPAHEERETIKALLIRDSKFKEGDKWYLLSSKWWELWMGYVNFDEESSDKVQSFSHNSEKITTKIFLL